jgi:hypothetical protein
MPDPVPALPDSERISSHTISGVGPYAVSFDVYGDGTDYQNWIEVYDDGVKLIAVTDWTLDSPSGSLGALSRPITDARVTLTSGARSGTLQIVGARRPRRTTQLTEGVGESARSENQTYTDIIATQREFWDQFRSTIRVPPGEGIGILGPAAARANTVIGFDSNGNPEYLTAEQDITRAVRYDIVQGLTSGQKTQALANLGLVDVDGRFRVDRDARFTERFFSGAATPTSWNVSYSYGTNGTPLQVVNKVGGVAVYGASRSSDGGGGQSAAIGVFGKAFNDRTAGDVFVWGGYFEGRNFASGGGAHGVEIDISNFGTVVATGPYAPYQAGTTHALWLACGGDATLSNPAYNPVTGSMS